MNNAAILRFRPQSWVSRCQVLAIGMLAYVLVSTLRSEVSVVTSCLGPIPLLYSSSARWLGVLLTGIGVGLIGAYLIRPTRATCVLTIFGFFLWFVGVECSEYVAARIG